MWPAPRTTRLAIAAEELDEPIEPVWGRPAVTGGRLFSHTPTVLAVAKWLSGRLAVAVPRGSTPGAFDSRSANLVGA